MGALVAGVDCSTQTTKVVVVDPDEGRILAVGAARHTVSGTGGARETDPRELTRIRPRLVFAVETTGPFACAAWLAAGRSSRKASNASIPNAAAVATSNKRGAAAAALER